MINWPVAPSAGGLVSEQSGMLTHQVTMTNRMIKLINEIMVAEKGK